MNECSGWLPNQHWCKHGFPQNGACMAPGGIPICCNEAVTARLWPETGKPDLAKLEQLRRDVNGEQPQ